MGHTRLGKIPTTRRWRDVVATFSQAGAGTPNPGFSSEIPKIASSTLGAATNALHAGVRDGGLGFIFYFLTQLALSARRPENGLEELGIHLTSSATSLDLTTEVHRVLDEHFQAAGTKSDVAEMAQLAIGETLIAYFRERPRDLFAPSAAQLAADLHQLGTQKTFGQISRNFFANFMNRMLGFYVSKFALPGQKQHLLKGADDLSNFNAELKLHTYQRAAVIHEFAEKWFSKTEFEKGIDPNNTRRFVAHACKKLEEEFMRGMDGE